MKIPKYKTVHERHGRHVPALLAIVALMFLTGLTAFDPQAAHASGDAYFTLSPGSGSYTIGNTLTLKVYETSSSSDDVEGVQANLSYNATDLECIGVSVSGTPFTYLGQDTCSGGTIQIGEASGSTVSGQQFIGSVTFKVLKAGSTKVAMTSGSDIQDSSTQSVWNGSDTSASYTLSNPVQSGGGSSGGSSRGGSTGSGSSGSSGSTSKPNTSTTPAPTTGTMTVTVTGSTGKPVRDAMVSVLAAGGTKHTNSTNALGIAVFNNLPVGSYTVSASSTPNMTGTPASVTVAAGKDKAVTLNLSSILQQPQAATLTITVTDNGGKPVTGAEVALSSKESSYTNAQGTVLFETLPSGTYTVTVTAPGKKPTKSTVTLTSGQVRTVSLKLASSSSLLLPVLFTVVGIIVVAGFIFTWLRLKGRSLPLPHLPLGGARVSGMSAGSVGTVGVGDGRPSEATTIAHHATQGITAAPVMVNTATPPPSAVHDDAPAVTTSPIPPIRTPENGQPSPGHTEDEA